jgi:hypothetical protein
MHVDDNDVMGDIALNSSPAQSEVVLLKACPLKIVDGEIDVNVSGVEAKTGAWARAVSGR